MRILSAILVLAVSLPASLFGQETAAEYTYLVITISRTRNWDLHGKELSYWITEASSPQRAPIPLYSSGFSKTVFQRCCAGDSVALYNTSDTEFDLDDNEASQLMELLRHNQIQVQKIKKRWGRHKEVLEVSIAPVIGLFCLCKISKIGPQLDGWSQLAIPRGPFRVDSDFLSKEKNKEYLTRDYSEIDFILFSSIL